MCSHLPGSLQFRKQDVILSCGNEAQDGYAICLRSHAKRWQNWDSSQEFPVLVLRPLPCFSDLTGPPSSRLPGPMDRQFPSSPLPIPDVQAELQLPLGPQGWFISCFQSMKIWTLIFNQVLPVFISVDYLLRVNGGVYIHLSVIKYFYKCW